MNNTLRWIAFIPGAFLGSAIAYAAAILFFGGSSWLIGLPFFAPLNTFISGGLSGYAMVFAGAYISPAEDKKTPIIIIATITVFLGAFAIIHRLTQDEWFRSIEGVCVIVGAIIAISHVSKEASGRWRL